MTKLADDLLEAVKTTVTIPASQVLLTNTRILAFADDEVEAKVVPMLMGLNQNYFSYLEDEVMTSGQDTYNIPYRAIGRTLRDLKISDNGAVRDLNLIPLEDAHLYQYSSIPQGFYFMGDEIKIVPTPNSSTLTLKKYYPLKPNYLVETSDAGKITARSGLVLTLNSMPSTFTTNALVDIIQGKQGNRLYNMDVTITNVTGLQITLSAAATSVAINDYVAVATKSPVIQLPDEVFSYLVFLTSKRCLEAIGDFEGAKAIDKECSVRKMNCEKLLAPRIEGESIKILNRNGLLRGSRGRFTRGIVF